MPFAASPGTVNCYEVNFYLISLTCELRKQLKIDSFQQTMKLSESWSIGSNRESLQ
jgi:hypothetical protein